jgi:membrane protein
VVTSERHGGELVQSQGGAAGRGARILFDLFARPPDRHRGCDCRAHIPAGTVRGEVSTQLQDLLGPAGAQAVNAMLVGASKPMEGTLATVLGVGALMFAAVGVVVQLKDALNTVWEVEPPKASGIWHFVRTYVVSLAAVLSLGFLLLVSLVLTTALAAGGKYIAPYVPEVAMHALGSALSFGMITLLFAMMFKWLPDTYVAWRDVWLGAAVTAALFEVGKLLIGLYIGKQGLESTYGAAASLVVLLIWVYYSSQLVLMGAEFTRIYAIRRALGHASAGHRPPVEPQGPNVDHFVHVAVRRSSYAAAITALLLGWLFGRFGDRNQCAGRTRAI